MKRTRQLFSAMAVLAFPAIALGQGTDLRGPAPQAGRTITLHHQSSTEESEMIMQMQGQNIQGSMAVESDQLIQVDIVEVEDGQATHVRQTFVKNTSTTQSNIMGQKTEQTTGQEIEGLILDQTLVGEDWETVFEGADQLPTEALNILENVGYMDPRLLYPEEAVEVGDEWTVEGDALNLMMSSAGMPMEITEGESVFELVEIREIDGVSTAIISYDVSMTMEMDITQPGMTMEMIITMEGSGEIERSLDTYLDTNTFEGDMGFEMIATQGGQVLMKMSSQMPATSTATQTEGEADSGDNAIK